MFRLPSAVGAAAEDRQVAYVGLEAVPFVQGGDQGTDCVRADLGDPAAVPADQVHVVGVGGQVVGRRPVMEVGVGDHADVLEQLERAVDGGDVDAAGGLLDLGADLFRGRVVELRHRFQHELALRRHPVAAGPQLLVPPAHGQAGRRYLPVHGLILVPPVRSDARRNPLACQPVSRITCEVSGKGGGPTVCIDSGHVRWLSASRQSAGMTSSEAAAG